MASSYGFGLKTILFIITISLITQLMPMMRSLVTFGIILQFQMETTGKILTNLVKEHMTITMMEL